MNTETKQNVLRWFTGKALIDATTAIQMLEDSEAAGEWVPRACRFVSACLARSKVASKIAQEEEGRISTLSETKGEVLTPSWYLMHYMEFGMFERAVAANFDFAAFEQALESRRSYFGPAFERVKAVLAEAKGWVQDMTPIAKLMGKLDATRPLPIITHLGASPTVSATLKALGLVANISTIRMAEVKWEEIERIVDGKKIYVKIGTVIWPAGTVHNASRYRFTDHNEQCQACGHAIKNAGNWVPLVIDSEIGVPHSLWVGVDCSRTIFGISVKGSMELSGLKGDQ